MSQLQRSPDSTIHKMQQLQSIYDRLEAVEDGHVRFTNGRGDLGARSGCGNRAYVGAGGTVHFVVRFLWEINRGRIPPEQLLKQMCDYESCCNLDHYSLKTWSEIRRVPASDRFKKHIDKNCVPDCWMWIFPKNRRPSGRYYGQIYMNGRFFSGRRAALILEGIAIPEGHVVICLHPDNEGYCVNPAHLKVVPRIESDRMAGEMGRRRKAHARL